MLLTWQRTIAKYLQAFITIAKKAMPFGDHLSLKSESDFSTILSLNLCWRLGKEQLLSVGEHLLISLNIDWRLSDLLLLKQKQ